MPLKPNLKASVYNQADVSADTDVFASNVTPSEPPTEFLVEAAFNNATRIKLKEWDGTTETVYNLNGNNTVDASDLARVSHLARSGSEYNIQLGSAADVRLLAVAEEHLQGE